jgi:hypothetical protein
MEKTILDIHKESVEHVGFWDETDKRILISAYEAIFNTETLKNFYVVNIVINDKVLVKWEPRLRKLTDEEVKKKYGR